MFFKLVSEPNIGIANCNINCKMCCKELKYVTKHFSEKEKKY